MSQRSYTDEELNRYFNDPTARRRHGASTSPPRPTKGVRGYFHRRFDDPKKAQAAFALSIVAAFLLLCTLGLGLFTLTLADDLPPFSALDNPELQLATVAYTADGQELARYAFQNRSWVTYDEISPHVINALVATEDHRFHQHWGIDLRGIMAAVAEAVTTGDLRGASTISQQLARNLYNQEIGFEVTPSRKLKEMITAVQLERRYTKREIIEMYLNTVEFGYNAFGIEAAAKTFFGKPAAELDPLESATLVGMLQATTYYNPIRNPENSQRRRNIVLAQMIKHDFLDAGFLETHRDDPIVTDFNPSEITASLAPYFAEYVRNWMKTWAKQNEYNFYEDGLRVYTTLDSRMQELARAAVDEQMKGLQAVVDYEWSRPSGYHLGGETDLYLRQTGYEPFDHFWTSQRNTVNSFIRDTDRFRSLRKTGVSADEAITTLRRNEAFMDSLKTEKTRLEAGLVALDPHTGYVKAWVGGRNLEIDWYDHVATAKRQPGSTFKPFVYTAAIDNGYPPSYTLPDSTFTYRIGPGNVWRPGNSEGEMTGRMMTLREALALSKNMVTARVITQLVNPSQVAFYARRMGITSELAEVPALALGVSDVTLLEMVSAYGTLASGGLHYDPTVVTRIEDRFGNVLYEARPAPEEALSEATAYTVVDMMRGTIDHPQGTGARIRWQFGLGDYDLAGKTGTTSNSGSGSGGSDNWFIMMHPELVTGAWVGFNDRRVTFRSSWWGQGAHTALFLVGDFFQRLAQAEDVPISQDQRFPAPSEFGLHYDDLPTPATQDDDEDEDRRVGW